MPYQNLIFEKKDHIGTITFNRPRVLNALNRETMDELDALLSEARSDSRFARADSHRGGR